MKYIVFLFTFFSITAFNAQQLNVINAEDFLSAGIGVSWELGSESLTTTLGLGAAFSLLDNYLDTMSMGTDPLTQKIPSLELLPFLKGELKYMQIDEDDLSLTHRLVGESLLVWPFLTPFTSDSDAIALWNNAAATLPSQNLHISNTAGLNSRFEYGVNDPMWRIQGFSAEIANTMYFKNSWIIPEAWSYYKAVLELRYDQMLIDKYLYLTTEFETFYKANIYGNVPLSEQFIYYPINGKVAQFGNTGYYASMKLASTIAEFELFLPFSVSLVAFYSTTVASNSFANLDITHNDWSIGACAELKTVLLDALAIPVKLGASWSGDNIQFLLIFL